MPSTATSEAPGSVHSPLRDSDKIVSARPNKPSRSSGQTTTRLRPLNAEELAAWMNPPPVPPTARHTLGPRRVRVAGRKIDFPYRCPCCLDRPDATLTVRFVQVVGDRIVRAGEDAWEVPYCQACLDTMSADRQLVQRFARERVRLPALGTGLAVLVSGAAMAAPALGLGLADRPVPWWLLVVLPILGLIGSVVLWRMRRAHLLATARPTCATTAAAVEIVDSASGQQEFLFAHSTYAEEFARVNSRRLLEG